MIEKSDVIQLGCPPLPVVRIAFIGLGRRGKQSFGNYMHLDGVEIRAVCDVDEDNLREVRALLKKNGRTAVDGYSGAEDWKTVCGRDDIDLVYVCTCIRLHAEIAVYAMACNKHVAVEVPIADTVEDCWRIVEAAEKYRRHCIMLENCCYGRFEMAALNMCSHGVLGDVIHAEGSYIHDLRHIDFKKRPDYLDHWLKEGNPYPTHGLGPVCQALGIHRRDRLSWAISVSNGQFCFPETGNADFVDRCVLGNTNTTIIMTEKQKTIVLQHDISSPRPYWRNFLLSGTEGFIRKAEPPIVQIPGCTIDTLSGLYERFEHPFYVEKGKQAASIGAHEGMDFMMDYRLVHCLQRGLPLDMDVYDAVEWSCLVELTALSIQCGHVPVQIPDFTRGAWCRTFSG